MATILREISAVIDEEAGDDTETRISSTVRRHARQTAAGLLARSAVIRDRRTRGSLDIVVAIYDLASGRVAVLPNVSSMS